MIEWFSVVTSCPEPQDETSVLRTKAVTSSESRRVKLSGYTEPFDSSFAHPRRIDMYQIDTTGNRDTLAVFQIPLYGRCYLIVGLILLVAGVLTDKLAIQRIDSYGRLTGQVGNFHSLSELRSLILRVTIVRVRNCLHRIEGTFHLNRAEIGTPTTINPEAVKRVTCLLVGIVTLNQVWY